MWGDLRVRLDRNRLTGYSCRQNNGNGAIHGPPAPLRLAQQPCTSFNTETTLKGLVVTLYTLEKTARS